MQNRCEPRSLLYRHTQGLLHYILSYLMFIINCSICEILMLKMLLLKSRGVRVTRDQNTTSDGH